MTNASKLIIENLASIGELYCLEYVDAPEGWARDNLRDDWWAGLKFYLDHSFMQNRPANTSWKLRDLTVSTLADRLLVGGDSEAGYAALQEAARANQLDSLLPPVESGAQSGNKATTQLKKRADRSMVRCILAFVARDQAHRNIFSVVVDRLRQMDNFAEALASTHQFLDDFDGVGEKIAPFILQDIALLCRHESLFPPNLTTDAYRFAFPIDTLIRQLAPRLGCTASDDGDGDQQIREHFIRCSLENGVFPPLCAAGLWYLEFHSSDILVQHVIKKIRLGRLELPDGQ
jgi:hypothetical protein